MKRIATLITLVLSAVTLSFSGCTKSSDTPSSSTSGFTTFQSASLVLGQTDFVTDNYGAHPLADSLGYPFGVAASSSKLYISDQIDHRVVGYTALPTSNGQHADFAVGQTNLTTATSGSNPDEMDGATGVAISGTYMAAADESNHRVLIWNTLPSGKVAANVALGHTGTTGAGSGACATNKVNSPDGVHITPAGKVIVASSGTHRIMIWNDISTLASGAAADVILGDTGVGCSSGVTGTLMDWPAGVWSDDSKLVVADVNNNRVLIWNTFPTTSGTAASVVLGQTTTTGSTGGLSATKMQMPWGVTSDGTRLFVSDVGNNRILIWNTFPTTNGEAATAVLGQNSFTSNTENDDDQDGNAAAPSARTIYFPSAITIANNKLYVTDRGNHRVLVFAGQ